MEKTFLQKKKMQRILVLVLLAVAFVTAAVVWWGFFSTAPVPATTILPFAKRVEVDTGILLDPIFDALEEPRAKAQIPPDVGRGNPFVPAP